jgi:hypothetical protein
MQTVKYVSDVESTVGCLGFSVLQKQYDGTSERMTLLFLRDAQGWSLRALIAPAVTFRGAF